MSIPPEQTAPYGDEIDLRALFLQLWRQRWLVVAITLAAMLAAALASLALPGVYRVESLVELEKMDTGSLQQSEGREILESRALLTAALKELAITTDPRDFEAKAEVIKDTRYLKFSLEGPDPAQVTRVTGKMVDLFVAQRNKLYQERRATVEKNLQEVGRELEQAGSEKGRINELIANLEEAPLSEIERKLYALQLAQLQGFQAQEKMGLKGQFLSLQDRLAGMNPAQVVDATSEAKKVRPRLLLNTAVAMVLGLMAGVFLALGRNWLAGLPPVASSQK